MSGAIPDTSDVASARLRAPGPPPADLTSRLASLESAVAALARDLGELKKKLGEEL